MDKETGTSITDLNAADFDVSLTGFDLENWMIQGSLKDKIKKTR